MDAMTNLLTRRSVRSYKPDPVCPEALERILTAGTYAATGMNKQA
ncbi:MAG: nitroreductase family protein, partial [Clostridia bacterium]|nr:nitroreductase family protein [Clostridia bacterium]